VGAVPISAVALVVVVLLVIWFFLAHMISSRKDDARLQFLLGLMGGPTATADRPDPDVLRTAATMPETRTRNGVEPEADDVGPHAKSRRTLSVWQELPVVLAAALRGRAM
jgi:hypothetical protein